MIEKKLKSWIHKEEKRLLWIFEIFHRATYFLGLKKVDYNPQGTYFNAMLGFPVFFF